MISPETIARVCHEANRALQAAQADPTIAVAAAWDDCGAEMQASAVDGVRAVMGGADSRASHENWVRFKTDHGWTYGLLKDETRKEHPLLISYEELPESQRVKDDLFGAIVQALSPAPPEQRSPEQQARHEQAKARFFTASEHPPVVALRTAIVELGALVDEHVPAGRNKSLALTALEDVQMRGNRGIFAPENLR